MEEITITIKKTGPDQFEVFSSQPMGAIEAAANDGSIVAIAATFTINGTLEAMETIQALAASLNQNKH